MYVIIDVIYCKPNGSSSDKQFRIAHPIDVTNTMERIFDQSDEDEFYILSFSCDKKWNMLSSDTMPQFDKIIEECKKLESVPKLYAMTLDHFQKLLDEEEAETKKVAKDKKNIIPQKIISQLQAIGSMPKILIDDFEKETDILTIVTYGALLVFLDRPYDPTAKLLKFMDSCSEKEWWKWVLQWKKTETLCQMLNENGNILIGSGIERVTEIYKESMDVPAVKEWVQYIKEMYNSFYKVEHLLVENQCFYGVVNNTLVVRGWNDANDATHRTTNWEQLVKTMIPFENWDIIDHDTDMLKIWFKTLGYYAEFATFVTLNGPYMRVILRKDSGSGYIPDFQERIVIIGVPSKGKEEDDESQEDEENSEIEFMKDEFDLDQVKTELKGTQDEDENENLKRQKKMHDLAKLSLEKTQEMTLQAMQLEKTKTQEMALQLEKTQIDQDLKIRQLIEELGTTKDILANVRLEYNHIVGQKNDLLFIQAQEKELEVKQVTDMASAARRAFDDQGKGMEQISQDLNLKLKEVSDREKVLDERDVEFASRKEAIEHQESLLEEHKLVVEPDTIKRMVLGYSNVIQLDANILKLLQDEEKACDEEMGVLTERVEACIKDITEWVSKDSDSAELYRYQVHRLLVLVTKYPSIKGMIIMFNKIIHLGAHTEEKLLDKLVDSRLKGVLEELVAYQEFEYKKEEK